MWTTWQTNIEKEDVTDVFTYYVDAEASGIEANKEALQAERKEITRCLTEKARTRTYVLP